MQEQAVTKKSSVSKTLFWITLLVFLSFPLAGIGTRLAWWNYAVGLTAVKWLVYVAVIFLIFAVITFAMSFTTKGAVNRRSNLWAVLFCLIPVSMVGHQYLLMKKLPVIHDITTDTKNPPKFMENIHGRGSESNSLQYAGEKIAAQQQSAYPNVQPIITETNAEKSYIRVLRLVKRNSWEIVDANPSKGTLEAVATTFWFGFKDDVSIRVMPEGSGARVDIRSVSRVGKSDVGTNAKRIEQFAKQFRDTNNQDKARDNAEPATQNG